MRVIHIFNFSVVWQFHHRFFSEHLWLHKKLQCKPISTHQTRSCVVVEESTANTFARRQHPGFAKPTVGMNRIFRTTELLVKVKRLTAFSPVSISPLHIARLSGLSALLSSCLLPLKAACVVLEGSPPNWFEINLFLLAAHILLKAKYVCLDIFDARGCCSVSWYFHRPIFLLFPLRSWIPLVFAFRPDVFFLVYFFPPERNCICKHDFIFFSEKIFFVAQWSE